jgi:hypothetical protein
MRHRKKVPDATQAEVLVQSRRRCCLCFGLNRDDKEKKGQIAHLDGNRNNNKFKNLVFLCFDHHDEYDSKTRQSKGLMKIEVERYRDELAQHFGAWSSLLNHGELLNFLASSIDLDTMADAAVRVCASVVFYGEELAFEVLIENELDSIDADTYVPHLIALDHFASWGWLTYTEEEREVGILIKVLRKPVCNAVAGRILERLRERGGDVSGMLRIAQYLGWAEPNAGC